MGDERCLFCNEPATRLCDQAIGLVWTGERQKAKGRAPHRVTSMEAMLSHDYTCSAPCCDKHAHVAGFICGKDSDTIDHCAGCFGLDLHPVGLLTPAEIDVRRRMMHAAYRRSRICSMTTTAPGERDGG